MISLKGSEFLVECDDAYNHHIFVRSPKGYDEITNGDYNKDALINDLVYAVSELVKERDKKQYPILEQIRTEIDLETRAQVKHCTNTDAVIDEVLDIIDEYTGESEAV